MSFAARLFSLNPPMVGWRGQRVWVIGASTGIGNALASALHKQGAVAFVSGRRRALLDEFTAQHPGAVPVPLDTRDRNAVHVATQAILAGGRLDLVVYCAGHFRELGAADYDLGEMLAHLDVNYIGALHVLDAVLPAVLAQGRGHLSLVGSVAGWRGLPRSIAYGPTKAALRHLAESMYLELRPRGIGVSVVSPGFVDTPLTEQNRFPMPALISPEQAAKAMLRGWAKGRFEVHFPGRFTWPMKLLSVLPFAIYQALVRRGTGL